MDADGALQITQHKTWAKELRKKRVDYSGHVVSEAVPFTWEQVEAARRSSCGVSESTLALACGGFATAGRFAKLAEDLQ